MERTTQFPTPPWDMDSAAERLKFEEQAWNTHDPDRISEGYAGNIEMRDGTAFITDRNQLKSFLAQKFAGQSGFRLKLDLWGALKARMAVRFEAEWKDPSGQWLHAYGVLVLQFNESGLIERRFASEVSTPVAAAERTLA